MNPKQQLAHALRHPFDDREPTDSAHAAALGVLSDLTGRGGDTLEGVDDDLKTEIVDSLSAIIREAFDGVGTAGEAAPALAPQLDRVSVSVRLLDWNRAQKSPPIAIASEYAVAAKVMELVAGAEGGGATSLVVPREPDGNFNTGDKDLDLLLGLTEDLAGHKGNMDTAIWFMEVLKRVKGRLGPTGPGAAGE